MVQFCDFFGCYFIDLSGAADSIQIESEQQHNNSKNNPDFASQFLNMPGCDVLRQVEFLEGHAYWLPGLKVVALSGQQMAASLAEFLIFVEVFDLLLKFMNSTVDVDCLLLFVEPAGL